MTTFVFVYGTLRPGFGNDRLWQHRGQLIGRDGEFRVPGFRLVTHGWFPYAIPAPCQTIVGSVIEVDADTLAAIDSLEGYPHHYDRVWTVAASDRRPFAIGAWLYTPTYPGDHADGDQVPENDWALFDLQEIGQM